MLLYLFEWSAFRHPTGRPLFFFTGCCCLSVVPAPANSSFCFFCALPFCFVLFVFGVGNFPAEEGVDFFEGVDGFLVCCFSSIVTIFCVACGVFNLSRQRRISSSAICDKTPRGE
jgi:hypothetical protein